MGIPPMFRLTMISTASAMLPDTGMVTGCAVIISRRSSLTAARKFPPCFTCTRFDLSPPPMKSMMSLTVTIPRRRCVPASTTGSLRNPSLVMISTAWMIEVVRCATTTSLVAIAMTSPSCPATLVLKSTGPRSPFPGIFRSRSAGFFSELLEFGCIVSLFSERYGMEISSSGETA